MTGINRVKTWILIAALGGLFVGLGALFGGRSGVLAHEISHVANHDILISSIAAAIGTAITWIAYMAFWFGGSDDEGGGNPIVGLLAVLLAPLAAGIIQMAVSRSREYQADESGAITSHDPEALASALRKIDVYVKRTPPATLSPSQAHLFIMNPFSGKRTGAMMANLFSTHPPTEQRVARLEHLREEMQEHGEPVP